MDGDDNGLQVGGSKSEVISPLISLQPGTEPVGDVISGAESGVGGDLDQFVSDTDGDMTVDFGFTESGVLGVGNVVYFDEDGDSKYSAGEGTDDITLELYHEGDTPGTDLPLATTVTADGGKYLFWGLREGHYFIHIPAVQFQAAGLLRGQYSLVGLGSGDDDYAPGINDVADDGIDSADPASTGINSRIIVLTEGGMPISSTYETGFDSDSDLADDNNIDLTVDFGFFRPVAVGNLVFVDNNSSGAYTAGEGIDGVVVELYKPYQLPGIDSPVRSTVTTNGGRYLFDYLRPGNYFVHIAAENFAAGGPLFQRVSINEGLAGDDDVGEDGLNSEFPQVEGVSSSILSLYVGLSPSDITGESGVDASSDNANEVSTDLTVDFGFQSPVGVGNLVFIDANGDGVYNPGEGVDGVRVELYLSSQTPGTTVPLFSQTTSDGGKYFFDQLPSGTYVIYVPASEFRPGAKLADAIPLSTILTGDDDVGQNALAEANPSVNGARTGVITLAVDGAPTSAGIETGFSNDSDDWDDNNFDLTIDLGFGPSDASAVGIGNLVFKDLNSNGVYDVGEGVTGVKVQLFYAGMDPLLSAPVAETTTTEGGIYLFSNRTANVYFVYIPASEFGPGKPLYGWASMPGAGGDDGVDDNLDENGLDVADAMTEGIRSAEIELSPDSEPVNEFGEVGAATYMDNANDDNTDLTVDFGFYRTVSIGNLVFNDTNYNGRAEAGEGVIGVTVELYHDGEVPSVSDPISTEVTDANGFYLFAGLAPGSYIVHVTAENFLPGGALANRISITSTSVGDDDLGEDGIDENTPEFYGISSDVVVVVPGACPAGTAEAGLGATSDDGDDAGVDLTVDFGFVDKVCVGNLVFDDKNNDGVFDQESEFGIDSVTVELWQVAVGDIVPLEPLATTVTSGGGLYNFCVAPGTYYIRIPASEFQTGGPLEYRRSSTPNEANGASNTDGDDDVGEDGIVDGSALANGVRSPEFSLLPTTEPTWATGETGYNSFDDDITDADSDLTVDFGFAPKPLTVGNLVYRDVVADGVFGTGDVGIAGVHLKLYRLGDDPSEPPVSETLTDFNGRYSLEATEPGSYYVHISPDNFQPGAVLEGAMSVVGFGFDEGIDDDSDEDGIDAIDPASTGIYSGQFDLAFGTEPISAGGSETGFDSTSDDAADGDSDLTIDFGFEGGVIPAPVSVGNIVFVDQNGNDHFDEGEGVDGVWMLLYTPGSGPAKGSYMASTFTSGGGRYLFTGLPPGTYTVHVAADNFKPNVSINGGPMGPGPLYGMISIPGAMNAGTGGDDQVDENGIDVTNPDQVGIDSDPISLLAGNLPTNVTTELGASNTQDDSADADGDLTVDFGFVQGDPPAFTLGNMVFTDANGNGIYDDGEGTGGVLVQLFAAGADPLTASPLDATITATSANEAGRYEFTALSAGSYFVYLPASNFSQTGPLYHTISIAGVQGVDAYAGPVGDDNLGEDGIDSQSPESTGIMSRMVNLQLNSCPVGTSELGFLGSFDNEEDGNGDLTVDFGFTARLGIGNLVYVDRDVDGKFQAGIDMGLPNVPVEAVMIQGSNEHVVASTTTDASGSYRLWVNPSRAYKLRIPATQWGLNGSLRLLSPTIVNPNGLDDNDQQDAIATANPALLGVSTSASVYYLGAQPVDANGAESGFAASSDNSEDTNVNLTMDFGLKAKGPGVGNLVFKDLNGNGWFDVGIDEPLGGVVVKLFPVGANPASASAADISITAADGTYLLMAPSAGNYFVHIPASEFQATGDLNGYVTASNPASSNVRDDSGGPGTPSGDHNAYGTNLESNGMSSSVVSLNYTGMPVNGTVESGFANAMDDLVDAAVDLTMDFGFVQTGAPLANRTRNSLPASSLEEMSPPTGSFYDVATGQIVHGGYVAIEGPGSVNVVLDGETGQYQFSADVDGIYTLEITPPAGYLTDRTRPSEVGAFDSTAKSAIVSIGSSENRNNPGFLLDSGALANPWYRQIHLVPGAAVPVNNNIPLMLVTVDTFEQWRLRNSLGGKNAATDDADGDGMPNLLEYALGLKADSGLASTDEFHLEMQPDGSVDAIFTRPVAGHGDITYHLEAINDLTTSPQGWQPLIFAPEVGQSNAEGRVVVRYRGVDAAAIFADQSEGYLRLRISLNADHNGLPEAAVATSVFAWTRRTFEPGQQTFSMSLLQPESFAGSVIGMDGDSLTFAVGEDDIASGFNLEVSYYLEVLTGSRAGHRFDVNVSGSSAHQIALDMASSRNTLAVLPPDIVGAKVAVRPHWTSSTVLPTAFFGSAKSSSGADRLLFFDSATNAYVPYWLYADGNETRWVSEGDLALSSANGRVVGPGEGMLVQVRGASPITVVHVGKVRSNRFIQRLSAGTQLIGGGYPVAQSPEDRSMDQAGGFVAGQDSASADRLRLWVGDRTSGATGYDSFYLHLDGTAAKWVREGDANPADQSSAKLFGTHRAAFIVRHNADAAHATESPWLP